MQQITENCIALGKVINKPNIQISFLSYLLQGTKNVLIDTVPQKASENWLHELSEALAGKPIDAIILNHSEEDHSGALSLVLEHNSEIPVYCTAACRARLQPTHPNVNFVCVDHGSSVRIGDFAFRFLHTPGLHWDDNMVTFFENDGTLFSNDLFGQYLGCEELKDNDLSADELLTGADSYFEKVFASAPAEKKQVIAEVEELPFRRIAPGHGVVINKNLSEILALYTNKCLA